MSSSEAVKRASRVYRNRHQEKVSAYNKRYGEKSKEMQSMTKKQYRSKHPEYIEQPRVWRHELRYRVLDYYSEGKFCCALCGEDQYPCLSIDHIDGGGNEHRRVIGVTSGTNFYRWLEKSNYPNGFRVLCANCQVIQKFKHFGWSLEKPTGGVEL